MNDHSVVRSVLAESIRGCGKSREEIAEAMSLYVGEKVTVRRLNGFTAESAQEYRFPAELIRAFCVATSDCSLLRKLAELNGFDLITETEHDLLELGRQYLLQKRSEQSIAMLERKLGSVDL